MIRTRESTDLRRRADEIFDRLIEQSDPRAALDHESCDDPKVLSLVHHLLEADETLAELTPPVSQLPLGSLSSAELGSGNHSEGSDYKGDSFGVYRLERLLGSGGMGEVFLAIRDGDPYRREIAIKVLRRSHGPELSRRFRTEQQAMALLEHPNIARMYDSGVTDDGRPYLVMEYIEGLSIHQYCAVHHLGVKARLQLFLQVCSAVDFAHRNLIVHRDIKPDNILVDEHGVPKLLDFGIAKLLDTSWDAFKTRTGMRPMTPSWASPEQVRGEPVTTATDIYSLGTLLYYLLVGSSPYQLGSEPVEQEVLRAVCEQEPLKPSSACRPSRREEDHRPNETSSWQELLRSDPRRLRGDLDRIVLKALAKTADLRYGSALEFRDDVDRHLNGHPVRARPPTLRYRSTKFIKRHRWAVTAAAGFMLVIITFIVTVMEQSRRLSDEKDRAEEALTLTLDLFRKAHAYTGGNRDITAHELLNLGARRIREDTETSPAVKATLEGAIGESLMSLSKFEQAEPLLREAVALHRQVHGDSHPDTLASLSVLAEVIHELGRYDEAEALYRQVLEAGQDLPPERLARALDSFGALDRVLGRYEASERKHRQALDIRRRDPKADPWQEAITLNYLGVLFSESGRYEESRGFLEQAVLLRAESPFPALVVQSQSNLVGLLNQTADYRAVVKEAQAALAILNRHFNNDHQQATYLYNQFAFALLRLGRLDEAASIFEEDLARRRTVFGEDHLRTSFSYENLGQIASARGSLKEAEALYLKTLEMRRAKIPEDHWLIGRSLSFLADVDRLRGDSEPAESKYTQALEILEKSFQEPHQALSPPLLGLGRVHRQLGELEEAEAFLRRALRIRLQRVAASTLPVAEIEQELGRCLWQKKEFSEAKPFLRRSSEVLRDQLPPGHLLVVLAAELEQTIQTVAL